MIDILTVILFAFFLGFSICIPIGPINLLTIKFTLDRRMKEALALALGGSFMDIVYFFILMNGIAFFQFNETVANIFKSVGILVIFLMGLIEVKKYLVDKKEISSEDLSIVPIDIDKKIEFKKVKSSKLLKAFLTGVFIYTSNPTLIATMSGLSAFVKSTHLFTFNFQNIAIFSIFAGLGTFSWFLLLAILVNKNLEKFNQKLMMKLNLGFGVLMMIVATVMATKLIFKLI